MCTFIQIPFINMLCYFIQENIQKLFCNTYPFHVAILNRQKIVVGSCFTVYINKNIGNDNRYPQFQYSSFLKRMAIPIEGANSVASNNECRPLQGAANFYGAFFPFSGHMSKLILNMAAWRPFFIQKYGNSFVKQQFLVSFTNINSQICFHTSHFQVIC